MLLALIPELVHILNPRDIELPFSIFIPLFGLELLRVRHAIELLIHIGQNQEKSHNKQGGSNIHQISHFIRRSASTLIDYDHDELYHRLQIHFV